SHCLCFITILRPPPTSSLFPYTTLFRSNNSIFYWLIFNGITLVALQPPFMRLSRSLWLSWFVKYDPDWQTNKADDYERVVKEQIDRKSTRLNSSHSQISYAVFCLKKKQK